MGRVRDIIENERGLISDTVATDKEVQATSGYRNHIIDGSFSLCQKSDTPIDGNGYSCVDMWYQRNCKIERAYDENGLTYAKCTCTDAEGINYVRNTVESARLFNHKTVTVSFELDSPDGLTNGKCAVGSHNTDDDYITLGSALFEYNSIRTRYSFTFNIDEASIMGDGFPLYVYIMGDNTSTNNDGKVFNVYNVQLEFGDVATPFEIEPAGITLSRAQRYYKTFDVYFGCGSDTVRTTIPLNMRISPSVTRYAASDYTDTGGPSGLHTLPDGVYMADSASLFAGKFEADARF